MRAAALLASGLLTMCSPDRALQQSAPPPAAAAPGSQSPAYSVANHSVRLIVTDQSCTVEHRTGNTEVGRLVLELRPPCRLLTWRQPPPGAASPDSDGRPVGAVGDPMAWQYASAAGVVTLAVIGDPVPENLRETSLYRQRQQQGMSCSSSVQAILVQRNEVQLSRKRAQVGILCAELGLDEKDFWLLAHP